MSRRKPRRPPRRVAYMVRYYDAASATYWRPVRRLRVIASNMPKALAAVPEAPIGGWRDAVCLGPV